MLFLCIVPEVVSYSKIIKMLFHILFSKFVVSSFTFKSLNHLWFILDIVCPFLLQILWSGFHFHHLTDKHSREDNQWLPHCLIQFSPCLILLRDHSVTFDPVDYSLLERSSCLGFHNTTFSSFFSNVSGSSCTITFACIHFLPDLYMLASSQDRFLAFVSFFFFFFWNIFL